MIKCVYVTVVYIKLAGVFFPFRMEIKHPSFVNITKSKTYLGLVFNLVSHHWNVLMIFWNKLAYVLYRWFSSTTLRTQKPEYLQIKVEA